MATDAQLRQLLDLIASAGDAEILDFLAASPALAGASLAKGAARGAPREHYLSDIAHYVYAGDTALHVAAAAYRPQIVGALIGLGAAVAASNRHGAQPLHYAADGQPGSPGWKPAAQAKTIERLIAAGADPNAVDKRGVTPLHRAVRTRCAAAVRALLDGGADPRRQNQHGSTPTTLAAIPSGRGGSGSADAKAQQAEIRLMLEPFYPPPSPSLPAGGGFS